RHSATARRAARAPIARNTRRLAYSQAAREALCVHLPPKPITHLSGKGLALPDRKWHNPARTLFLNSLPTQSAAKATFVSDSLDKNAPAPPASEANWPENWADLPLIALDVETTGLN